METIQIRLDADVAAYFSAVAKLAGVKPETVMKIALAQHVLNQKIKASKD